MLEGAWANLILATATAETDDIFYFSLSLEIAANSLFSLVAIISDAFAEN